MAGHKCLHEADLAKIGQQVETLDRIINGNGQQGLARNVYELNIRLEESCKDQKKLTEVVENLRTALSGFDKFQTSMETMIIERERNQAKMHLRKRSIQWLITSVITLIGIIVGLIFKK